MPDIPPHPIGAPARIAPSRGRVPWPTAPQRLEKSVGNCICTPSSPRGRILNNNKNNFKYYRYSTSTSTFFPNRPWLGTFFPNRPCLGVVPKFV